MNIVLLISQLVDDLNLSLNDIDFWLKQPKSEAILVAIVVV